MFKKSVIFIMVMSIGLCSGCTTTRSLRAARDRVIELEQLNKAGADRNTELENLLDSERIGNEELERILNVYLKSEEQRIIAERELANSLSGIFKEGSDIIEGLIRGYHEIRDYLQAKGLLVEGIDSSSDSSISDSCD